MNTLLVCTFYHFRPFQPRKWTPPWPVYMQTSTYPDHNIPLSCFIGSPLPPHTYPHITKAYKLHTYPYYTFLGYVLPSHPQSLSSLPVHSDRWAEPRSLCSRDRTEGKRPLLCSLSDSQKTAPMANKNTTQGTQMATRTTAAIVVWNVSHEFRQERRIRWMTQPRSWETRVRLRWCADDIMI